MAGGEEPCGSQGAEPGTKWVVVMCRCRYHTSPNWLTHRKYPRRASAVILPGSKGCEMALALCYCFMTFG